ncbi:hypothetical protein ACF1BQ_030965 [Bradyrhizobium sp. RDT10]
MGEAEEGGGFCAPLAAPLTREDREPTKLDQPRLEGKEHFLRISRAVRPQRSWTGKSNA